MSLWTLAIEYLGQGRYDESELLHKRALAIWEQTYGPEHVLVAATLNNLAALYSVQRRSQHSILLEGVDMALAKHG